MIIIKPNEEFVMDGQVFVYDVHEGHGIQMKRLRRLNPGELSEPTAKKTHSKKNPADEKTFVPPTLEETINFFNEKGYTKEKAQSFHEYYSNGNPPWTDGGGKHIRSWKQKALAVWMKGDEGKIPPTQQSSGHMEGFVF